MRPGRAAILLAAISLGMAGPAEAPATRGWPLVRTDLPAYDLRARIARGVRAKAWSPAVACGRPTRKGLPCRRKVAGGGPCYQHRGVGA